MSDTHLHALVLVTHSMTQDRAALARVVNQVGAIIGHAVSVVLGDDAASLTPMMQKNSAATVINRQWTEGAASYVRAGMKSLPGSCDAVLIMHGDQTGVTAADLRRLIAAWNGADSVLAAAMHGGQLTTPMVVPRCLFDELLQLRGDQDACSVARRHASRIKPVIMANAGAVVADDANADTPASDDSREVLL